MVFLKQYLTSKCNFIVKYFYPASHSELSTDKCMTEIKSDQKKLNESNALILKSLMEIRQSYAVPPERNYALPPGHNYALPPAQNYAIPAAPLAEREPQNNTRKTTKKLI